MQPHAEGEYRRFHERRRVARTLSTLLGIVDGILIDDVVNDGEIAYIDRWMESHREFRWVEPFDELTPLISVALFNSGVDGELRAAIAEATERVMADDPADARTAALWRLHGLVAGIVADESVSPSELKFLAAWLDANEGVLETRYPFDEIRALVTSARQPDCSPREIDQLVGVFSEFARASNGDSSGSDGIVVPGYCAVQPKIKLRSARVCLTGEFQYYRVRADLEDLLSARGAIVSQGVSRKLSYLIVGGKGNSCWQYECYGRKIEKAMDLRRKGATLQIVHEFDLRDEIID